MSLAIEGSLDQGDLRHVGADPTDSAQDNRGSSTRERCVAAASVGRMRSLSDSTASPVLSTRRRKERYKNTCLPGPTVSVTARGWSQLATALATSP